MKGSTILEWQQIESPLRTLLGHASEALKTKEPFGLLILSISNFHEVGYALGSHNLADLVQELAVRLDKVLNPEDLIARVRANEFGIVVFGDESKTQALSDKILGLFEQPFVIRRLPIELTPNVGVALAPIHGTQAEILLRRADAALQESKKRGGPVVFSLQLETYDPTRITLLSDLRTALLKKELFMTYQPKVNLKTNQITGAEALLRWQSPTRGPVSPGLFIPLAEKAGLIRPITSWVFEQSLSEACNWPAETSISINISTHSLYSDQITEDVIKVLRNNSFDPKRLVLEVTESAMIVDIQRAIKVLNELNSCGVSISVDDFGTGYSSLSLLTKIRINELKLDQTFVLGMSGVDTCNISIVRSTIEMAHSLGLITVAEGVEDEWTKDLLKSFNCDLGQGYYFSKPLKEKEIRAKLKAGGLSHV